MKTTGITLLLSLILINNLFGQLKIKGKVIDNNLKGIISANITGYGKDSTLLGATTSDSNGNFEIRLSSGKKVRVIISHIAYNSQTVEVDKDTSILVCLQEKTYLGGEIAIVAQKPAIEFKEGKIIANISRIPNSSTSNMAKIASRLPGVTANEREGLTINGKQATLYIDGQKQELSGSNVVKMLQAMPSASVDNVEMVSSSNGTLDASAGAILNIVTKKQRADGYSLNLGGTLATFTKNSAFAGGLNTFYMLKKNRLSLNGTFSYKNDYEWIYTNDSSVYSNGDMLIAKSDDKSRVNAYIFSSNILYNIKNGHNLKLYLFAYDDFTLGNMVQQTSAISNMPDKYTLKTKYKGNDDLWSGKIEYSSPDSMKSKIIASYGFIYGGIRSKTDFYHNSQWYLYTNPEMTGYQQTGKLDFIQNIISNRLKFQTGAKVDIGHLNDDLLNKSNSKNSLADNHFVGNENVFALYAQLSYYPTPKMTLSTTVRSELTDYSISLKTEQEKSHNRYNNIFPYLTLQYNISKNYKLILALISGIIRPNYEQMLPGIRYTNDYSYTVGNPNLKPTYTKGIALSNLLFGYASFTFRYEYLSDIGGLVLMSKANGITEYSFRNYADNRRFYASAYLPFQLFGNKLTGSINTNIRHNSLLNPKNGYTIPAGKGSYWQWTFKGLADYKVSKNLSANIWAGFEDSYKTPQFSYKRNWSMDAGIAYSTDNSKLNIAIDVENIFNTDKRQYRYYYDSQILFRNKMAYSRLVKLSVMLKLSGGEKLKEILNNNSDDYSRFRK